MNGYLSFITTKFLVEKQNKDLSCDTDSESTMCVMHVTSAIYFQWTVYKSSAGLAVS
jgi:hypothetical protein